MEVLTKTEKKFLPPQKKVVIKPVLRARGMVKDPNHEAYFLFGSSTIEYCLPMNRGNKTLKNPFQSKEEQEWLERELAMDSGALSVYKVKDNFWHKHRVRLGKEKRILDLSNPKDYIDYILLRQLDESIAKDSSSQMKKATYRYALVEETEEIDVKVTKAEKLKKAWTIYGKMEESNSKMLNFLKVYGHKVDENSKKEFLQSKVSEIIEKDIDNFIKLAEDKDFELKILIEDAVNAGVLIKTKREYALPGGDKLSPSEKIPATLDTVVNFLKERENQDILNMIKARLNNAKD